MATKPDKISFEQHVRSDFGFLETSADAHFRNCRLDDGDPRDAYIGCTFENDAARFTVAYSWFDLGVGVGIYLRRDSLDRKARGIYLEPWVEFRSEGRTEPLIPPFYPASRKFKPITDRRARAFATLGLPGILCELAKTLRENYHDVIGATDQEVVRYQEWFQRHS